MVQTPLLRSLFASLSPSSAAMAGTNASLKPINGVDAFEAIQLALIYVGVNLWSFSGRGKDALTWLHGKRGDLAFPTPPDVSMDPIMRQPAVRAPELGQIDLDHLADS